MAQQAFLGFIFKNTIEKQSAGTPFLESILESKRVFKNTIEKQSAGTPFLNRILDSGVTTSNCFLRQTLTKHVDPLPRRMRRTRPRRPQNDVIFPGSQAGYTRRKKG